MAKGSRIRREQLFPSFFSSRVQIAGGSETARLTVVIIVCICAAVIHHPSCRVEDEASRNCLRYNKDTCTVVR